MELRVTLLILSVINGIDAMLRAKRQYGFYQPPVVDWTFDPQYYQPYVVNYETSNSYGVPSSYNNYVDDRYSTSGRSLVPHQAPDGWRLDHQVQQNGYSQGRQRFDIPRIREFDRTLVSVTDGYATPPPEGFNGRGDVTSGGGRGDVIPERPSGDGNQWNTLRTDFEKVGFRKEDSGDVTTASPEVTTVDDVTSVSDDVTTAPDDVTTFSDDNTSIPDDVTTTHDDVTTTHDHVHTSPDDVTHADHDVTLLPDDVTDSKHSETSTSTEPSLTSDTLEKIVEDDINSLSTTTTTTTTTTSKPRSPPMPQEVMKKLKELGLVIDKNNTDMID